MKIEAKQRLTAYPLKPDASAAVKNAQKNTKSILGLLDDLLDGSDESEKRILQQLELRVKTLSQDVRSFSKIM